VSDLTLSELGATPKWRVFADSATADLAWSVSPGEWTVLGYRPGGDTVVDLTSVRAMFRLTGSRSDDLLSKICALDFGDATFPDGRAVRTLVAGVATEIVRDDLDGFRSYLLLPSRSYGRYMMEVIVDAGEEFELTR
jgi:heterotetrameric sarcosine oxidase gamma subunit